MDTFRWIAVTFSMILGLGITRVLSSAIAVFKSRHHATLDWIPLLWAASIFVLQIQFWWAIIELPSSTRTWSLPDFVLLLGIPIVLFVAAALVLPAAELQQGERLSDAFWRDGRWGLTCLSGYAVLALLVDVTLFAEPAMSRTTLYLTAEAALPLLFLVSPARRVRAGLTAGYFALVLWTSWDLSPKAY